MVNVYVTQLKPLADEVFNFWLSQLTPVMQNQVLRYKNWQDAHRSLLGKILLIKGLKHLKLSAYTLDQTEYNHFGKPFFKDGPHFNITHSGDYIACAISVDQVVGIDIEEVKPVPFSDFDDLFSKNEWNKINSIENDFTHFYTYWTRKEACIKAIGQGLNIPLKHLEVENNTIKFDEKVWFLKNLYIHENYCAAVATSNFEINVELLRVEI